MSCWFLWSKHTRCTQQQNVDQELSALDKSLSHFLEVIFSVSFFEVFSLVKGIFIDSNNIFSCHESEDINKKAYFQNFGWYQFQVFKLCMIMCVSLLPETTVLNKVSCTRIYVKNCSHFIQKWFHPNSFGELSFLEESYGNMQKNQILKILRVPSIQHQWVCL